jgi:hypothetical protein
MPKIRLVQRFLLMTALCCAAVVTPLLARAQTPGVVDPPARVGRLADMQGTVWIFDTQAGEWQAAARNRPLTTGDRLSTDNGARAEVRIGPNTVRLDGSSELEMLQLDDSRVSMQLHGGSVALRPHSREAARDLEVVTAEGRLTPQRGGYYRVDRNNDVTAATVWDGAMHFESNDSALDIAPGQRVQFWRDGPTHYSTGEPENDAFAGWARSRDRSDGRSASTRYVSPEMTGYEDLDRYGRWESAPDYGALWVPTVIAADWAPYRYGHWGWVSPWGWTWVDDAPWGFAPFHYGRWVWFRSHWCWAPGTYVARPVYAPALVAWVGGPQVGVSISIGSRSAPPVGWFPLGPREVYVPTYRHSPTYVQNVNITHVTNVTVINQVVQRPQQNYVNRQVFNAVTVVPADVLQRRQPVAPAVIRGDDVQKVVQGGVHHEAPVTAPQPRVANFVPGVTPVPAPPGRGNADPRRRDQEERGRGDMSQRPGAPGREPVVQGQQPAQPAAQTPPAASTRPGAQVVPPVGRPAEPQQQRPAPAQPEVSVPQSAQPRVVPPPPRAAQQQRELQREQRDQQREQQREERGRPVPAPMVQQAPQVREVPRAEPQQRQPAVVPQTVPAPEPQAEGRKQIPRPPEGRREREAMPQPQPQPQVQVQPRPQPQAQPVPQPRPQPQPQPQPQQPQVQPAPHQAQQSRPPEKAREQNPNERRNERERERERERQQQ